jgi:hypothetical protein
MFARVTRITMPVRIAAKAMLGSSRWPSASKNVPNWPVSSESTVYMPVMLGGGAVAALSRPVTGSRPVIDATICSSNASQNCGTPMFVIAKSWRNRSVQVPARRAAMTPRTMPERLPISSAARVSSSVAGKYCAMSAVTSLPVMIERPRLPWNSPLQNSAYCRYHGSSSPNSSRMRSIVSCDADGPAATLAGSPGMIRDTTKAIVMIPIRTGMTATTRRRTKFP